MTELLYLNDSYLREFDARVEDAQQNILTFDRTAFYPTGGGQPGDRGLLFVGERTVQVIETFKDQGRVLHRIEEEAPEVGTPVKGRIDWDLRYAHMRHHSAIHVLVGVAYKIFGSFITGGQIYSERARVDLDIQEWGPETVAIIEDRANQVVREARPITARVLPREEAIRIPDLVRTKPGLELVESLPQVRVVDIEGFDMQADGGTHVANTSEIGRIRVLKTESKGKRNKRMEISVL